MVASGSHTVQLAQADEEILGEKVPATHREQTVAPAVEE